MERLSGQTLGPKNGEMWIAKRTDNRLAWANKSTDGEGVATPAEVSRLGMNLAAGQSTAKHLEQQV